MKYLEHCDEVTALCALVVLIASVDWLISLLAG
jgi:hypothetical protein